LRGEPVTKKITVYGVSGYTQKNEYLVGLKRTIRRIKNTETMERKGIEVLTI